MEKIINLLKQGLTLENACERLKLNVREIKQELDKKYPLPKLQKTVGVELEGFSTLGYKGLVDAIKAKGIDIQYREWQHESLTGINNWTLTTDGTVKGFKAQNGMKGMEIVSPPLTSLNTLEKIVTIIRDGEALDGRHHIFKINRTCGLHVHFGTQGMDKNTLEKVYTLYRILEPYLDLMLSESRSFNDSYCRPIQTLSFNDAIKTETTKYWSVRAKLERVTIEFRKHQAATKFNRIQNWILILQQIILYAEKSTLVSLIKRKPSFEYLYEVLAHPVLIAYFNTRWKHFELKRENKLPSTYLDKLSNDIHRRLLAENKAY